MDTRPSILVVDDHASIRDPLATFMRRFDFEVEAVADGRAMRRLLEEREFSLIILDVMLPGEDGLSLCRYVSEHIGTPVILLTAITDQADRIAGLETGADDYVVKPFDPRELVARVRSVLRRHRQHPPRQPKPPAPSDGMRYVFSGWTLDIPTRELRSPEDEDVPLSTAEYHLLSALVEHPNRVLTRTQLLDLTQRSEIVAYDRSIDSQISRLRKKLEADPRRPRLLKTVRGDGYMLATKVALER
ncbi:response regulator [Cupriavidus plantarum]|uniref:response regulator n=1 Tax=Cupriavidus plantarum TaxID=942865 RepID=UPI000E2753EF|nr:response regulator [Cupriavidus plantarum]REF01446.1 two-component system OmpR family response regulator [Cupriavidus plantarum]